tara:strand:+ start:4595 stop:5848 length:1254 start_codon:yes stop_codon:yes gene_type:complete
MKSLRLIFLALLLGASIFFGYKIYHQEKLNQEYNDHLIELSDIKYGLFNADEWKSVFATVIADNIQKFSLENTDETVLKKEISIFLGKAIDSFEKDLKETKSEGGIASLLKTLSSFSGVFDQVKKQIPVFTDQIYSHFISGENGAMMQGFIVKQLDEYTKDSTLVTDYTSMNNIIKKYEGTNKTDTTTIIQSKIEENNASKKLYWTVLFIVFILFIVLLIFLSNKTKWEYFTFILYSLVLLALGVFLPMIAIDARIAELNFPFMGETIQFQDQVLFFKSKSIIEVVDLMISQNRLDLLFVGGLVFLFSVLFPLSKLISSIVYIFNKKLQNNRIIKFLVFKTGKWSMADVFVIALFMAYLGFDGLITEQLNQFQTITKTVGVLTTNNSGLLFGFYAFTGFVLFSLFISQKVKKLAKLK